MYSIPTIGEIVAPQCRHNLHLVFSSFQTKNHIKPSKINYEIAINSASEIFCLFPVFKYTVYLWYILEKVDLQPASQPATTVFKTKE